MAIGDARKASSEMSIANIKQHLPRLKVWADAELEEEKGMWKRITAAALLFLFVCGLIAGGWKAQAHAEDDSGLSGDVALLKQEVGNYVMQVTVENSGADFAGTVQLVFASSGYENCAYNTEITLPSQGKKQFTVTVTSQAAETIRGLCALNFLDEEGDLVQKLNLWNVFGRAVTGMSVGILTDDAASLGYLDAGGENFMFGGMNYPISLINLDEENLLGYLDGLYFLVIDRMNVASLGEEKVQAIQNWVRAGGWLMIGTGAYAEDTLSGFSGDFLDVKVSKINAPGETNVLTANMGYGYYSDYENAEIDLAQMTVAELDLGEMSGCFGMSSVNPMLCSFSARNMASAGFDVSRYFGDGAVAIFPVSLGEKELRKMEHYMIWNLYSELMSQSNSYRSFNGYWDTGYLVQQAFGVIDGKNTVVDFTLLEVLIGIYVVLAGPVLYLILKKCKKREWYWVGVPALGLLCIGGVYFFGQSARVNETRVYSVTVQQADSNREETYFMAYHSGLKEWQMRLNDGYETAGPGASSYYGYGNPHTDDYFYVVSNDSEGLSVGIKPRENFDNGFLYAPGRTDSRGSIYVSGLRGSGINGNVHGTVTNETDCDLAYMAVWTEGFFLVFSDVKAGETVDLQQAYQDGRCVYQDDIDYLDSLTYNMVSAYDYNSNLAYEQDDIAALLIGLAAADNARNADRSRALVLGVVRDYGKAVAGRCNETSYGCLYSFVEN